MMRALTSLRDLLLGVVWLLAVFAAVVYLAGCGYPDKCYPYGDHWVFTQMDVHATAARGYFVDDPKGELDIARLDAVLASTSRCVKAALPLSAVEKAVAGCSLPDPLGDWEHWQPDPSIRTCLVVKAAPTWHVSPCSGAQVFECRAPQASCAAKGQGTECPCSCRAAVQDNTAIITTPNLDLVPWRLTELLTGCTSIQNLPRLAQCGAVPAVLP